MQALPLPGYPGSTIERSLPLEQQLDLLQAQIEGSVLLGWSLGGLYAVLLAQRFPKIFKRLVLVAVAPRFVVAQDWPYGMSAAQFRAFAANIEQGEKLLKRFLLLQLHGRDDAKALSQRVYRDLSQSEFPPESVLQQGLDQLEQIDLRAALRSLGMPITVVLGGRDRLVNPQVADFYQRLGSHVKVLLWQDAGHLPMLTHTSQLLAECEIDA